MFEKMKPFLIIILVISPLVLCEETVDDLVQLFDDSKILSEFVKRLSAGHADTSDRPNAEHKSPTCKHQAFPKTIIATKASTSAGATFLDSEDGLGSNEECVQRCCEMDGCELAVYENKDKRNCYLFTCKDKTTGENLCHFANHDDYVSTSVTHSIHKQLAHSSTSEHENDLQDLSDVDKKPRPTTTTTTTTTTQKPTTRKTTTTTTTTEKPEVPHSVKLGEACRSINGCEDSHAICSSGTCSCKNLYYNKRGTCREVCGHSRFECQVVDLDGPDCIRLSLVCDGIKDCHDGSDELNCQTEENGKKTGAQSSSISGGLKAHQTGDNTHPDLTSSKKKIIHHEDNKSEEHKSSTEEKSEAKSTTDIKSNSTSDGKKPTANNRNTDNNKADTEGKTKQGGEGTSKVTTVEVDEEQSFIVTKEKVIVASPTSQAQGPIVALSLGLAFTFLLLVFLACRMRNIKRRLRKGRVLHSNEADYLINGMYL